MVQLKLSRVQEQYEELQSRHEKDVMVARRDGGARAVLLDHQVPSLLALPSCRALRPHVGGSPGRLMLVVACVAWM